MFFTEIPTALRFQTVVDEAIARINISRMESFVDIFDDFSNRYYTSESGVAAADRLFTQVVESIASSGYQGSASLSKYIHSWAQNSVIAWGPSQSLGLNIDLS